MAMFPGNRPASVTVDPEIAFTGPLKAVFPGSRAAAVDLDRQRDGNTLTRPSFASGRLVPTSDPYRDGDSGQTNNSRFGGEFAPGGNRAAGATNDPEHVRSSDAADLAKPAAPTGVVATGGVGQASIAFTPGAAGINPVTSYTAVSTPGGIRASGPASPIVVTGLTPLTAYTFKVYAVTRQGNGPSSTASGAVTPT